MLGVMKLICVKMAYQKLFDYANRPLSISELVWEHVSSIPSLFQGVPGLVEPHSTQKMPKTEHILI